jgi:hypothetical protein
VRWPVAKGGGVLAGIEILAADPRRKREKISRVGGSIFCHLNFLDTFCFKTKSFDLLLIKEEKN